MTNLNINQLFINCSSQTLCGIKPANLFTVQKENFVQEAFNKWKQFLEKIGLSVCAFKSSADVIMIFVYDYVWIRKILGDSFVQAYLEGKNYTHVQDTTRTLSELFLRLQTYKGFPHEVGVFLGYPVEDVINFEEHQGKFCKYCGYWKSYCNPEEAKKCCERYKLCSRMCRQWFEEGYSIPQIIKKYKELALEAA